MASGQLNAFLRHLRRVVLPRAADELTDAQLLERFVQSRDEAAFELLVWRHGPMVLNVCLRVLRRQHDAEDAFQATFLALARKASAIGNRESVGSWLYKVAYRVALRARTSTPARCLPQEPIRDVSASEPIIDLLWQEMRAVIDDEVNRLPDKYRIAFVLCHLEGQTIQSAARMLGCPQGTIGTRLARARELLRRRLARRGFDLSTLVMPRIVVAALPAALVDSTVTAALIGTADKAVAAGVISANVVALTKGALRTMALTKWILATAVVLPLTLVGGGAAFLAHRAQAVEPATAELVPADSRPPADEKKPAVVLRWKFEKDKPFYQEVTTTTKQTMKVMGMDVTQNQSQTFYFRWTPRERDRDGNWLLTQKIEGVKMDIDIGGNKIQFDSTKEHNADNSLFEFYKALIGAEFQVTIDKAYNIQQVEGRDELFKKLSASNPGIVTLLPQVLSSYALSQVTGTSFAALLDGPVRPGDSWTRKTKLNLGPIGNYQTEYKYIYEGKKDKLHKIHLDSTVEVQPPAEGGTGLPFKMESNQVKGKGTGTILFDRGKGRIACLELNLRLEGRLTLFNGGPERQAELSQTQTTRLKTSDVNPATEPDREEKREVERLREENKRLRRRLQEVEKALRSESNPKETRNR